MPSAQLEDVSLSGKAAICSATDATGTYLRWVRWGEQHPQGRASDVIVETNTYWRDIEEGEVRQIAYRSLDGEELKGWVILPVGYQEGRQYPMVTWAYAGRIYGDTRPSITRVNVPDSAFSLQLLAARGYAVLLPSMPLSPMGQASDPHLELPRGILPAVDRAVEMGIADDSRQGILGHSYGGYTVYSLITQTHRFRAAIAVSGFSDLASRYGIFDPRCRYGDFIPPQPMQIFWMYYFENGQGRMGNPPWKDRDRYLRNSPLTYVEHVKTPLMIIQGDHDYVAIEQGEAFFSALYRQGKPVRFVRYAGEGHLIEGRANVLDMWARMYEWFDQWLK
jgi:dipeptidyl aminopeptidase/acylaminoacyl peptidase